MTLVLQVFLFRDGQFLGTEMATGDRLEIGRDPTCDIVLQDDGASRKHALLFEAGGQVAVQDLGSANGTTLNGVRLTAPAYVGPRDDVGIGRHTIKLKLVTHASTSQPQPVITQDNVTISIDTVFYFTITDPFRSTYEVANVPPGTYHVRLRTLNANGVSLSSNEVIVVVGTSFSALTDQRGHYRIGAVPAGTQASQTAFISAAKTALSPLRARHWRSMTRSKF